MNVQNSHSKKILKMAIIVLALAIPLFLSLATLFYGHVTFWYDNARDIQTAWNNLQKPTLIGPTSGIPGIFYGPYWIWLLSLGVLISKDPVVVAFITATIPYFILFPLIWFRFSKFFGLTAVIIGWLLFMLSTGLIYSTQLWNPYPAPLLTLAVVYLLITVDHKKIVKSQLLLSALIGFFLGIVINFHISFGIGLLCGILIFLLWDFGIALFKTNKHSRKQQIITRIVYYASIGAGFFVAYLPALLFEVRHGFQQTQVLLNALTQYGDVVAIKGLSKPLILQEFINTFGKILQVPDVVATILIILLLLTFLILLLRKNVTLTQIEKRIAMIILSLLCGIMFIYFTARNPVWDYHFIGVDLILLLALTFLIAKIKIAKIAAVVLMLFIVVSVSYNHFTKSIHSSGLNEQKAIVNIIKDDAQNSDYTVIAYSSSIYMHEYSYLFRWIANKKISFDPSANSSANTLYLIIPSKDDPNVIDFVHFRAPESQYRIVKTLKSGSFRILKNQK